MLKNFSFAVFFLTGLLASCANSVQRAWSPPSDPKPGLETTDDEQVEILSFQEATQAEFIRSTWPLSDPRSDSVAIDDENTDAFPVPVSSRLDLQCHIANVARDLDSTVREERRSALRAIAKRATRQFYDLGCTDISTQQEICKGRMQALRSRLRQILGRTQDIEEKLWVAQILHFTGEDDALVLATFREIAQEPKVRQVFGDAVRRIALRYLSTRVPDDELSLLITTALSSSRNKFTAIALLGDAAKPSDTWLPRLRELAVADYEESKDDVELAGLAPNTGLFDAIEKHGGSPRWYVRILENHVHEFGSWPAARRLLRLQPRNDTLRRFLEENLARNSKHRFLARINGGSTRAARRTEAARLLAEIEGPSQRLVDVLLEEYAENPNDKWVIGGLADFGPAASVIAPRFARIALGDSPIRCHWTLPPTCGNSAPSEFDRRLHASLVHWKIMGRSETIMPFLRFVLLHPATLGPQRGPSLAERRRVANLAQSMDTLGEDLLLDACSHVHPSVRRLIVPHVAKLAAEGSTRSLAMLEQLAQDPAPCVRRAAQEKKPRN